MKRSMHELNLGLAAAAGALVMTMAAHAEGNKAVYEQARSTAKAEYDAARQQCKSLAGNAKDVCVAEAKLARTRAEAQAEAIYKATPEARREAADDAADAQYELARERCDDKGGNARDVCMKDARAAYEGAKADARADEAAAEARQDAAKDKRAAMREAQAERCDTLAGEAKDACLARARDMQQR